MRYNNVPLSKKTLLYKVSRFPVTLGDLTEKAKRDGENRMHVLAKCIPLREYPNGPAFTEVEIDVRYFHGRKTNRIIAYKTTSNSRVYNPDFWIKAICDYIEAEKLRVQTVRKKGFFTEASEH